MLTPGTLRAGGDVLLPGVAGHRDSLGGAQEYHTFRDLFAKYSSAMNLILKLPEVVRNRVQPLCANAIFLSARAALLEAGRGRTTSADAAAVSAGGGMEELHFNSAVHAPPAVKLVSMVPPHVHRFGWRETKQRVECEPGKHVKHKYIYTHILYIYIYVTCIYIYITM